jgi:hypothetical protein
MIDPENDEDLQKKIAWVYRELHDKLSIGQWVDIRRAMIDAYTLGYKKCYSLA